MSHGRESMLCQRLGHSVWAEGRAVQRQVGLCLGVGEAGEHEETVPEGWECSRAQDLGALGDGDGESLMGSARRNKSTLAPGESRLRESEGAQGDGQEAMTQVGENDD